MAAPQSVWKFKTGGVIRLPPIVSNNCVYISSDRLYCLNAQTGNPKWEFETLGELIGPAVVAGERIYFNQGGLHCVDVLKGSLIWEFWRGAWAEGTPAIADSFAYTIAGNRLYCIDISSAKLIWEAEVYPTLQPPIVSDGCVLISSFERIDCLDAKTGHLMWKKAMTDPESLESINKLTTVLTKIIGRKPEVRTNILDGRLFCTSLSNRIYSLEVRTGRGLWEREMEIATLHRPLISNEHLFIHADKIYCLEAHTGTTVWESSGGVMWLAPDIQITAGQLIVQWNKNIVRSLDARAGIVIRDYDIPSGGYAVENDLIYYYIGNTVLCGKLAKSKG